jgi:hypothetical protein
VLGTVVVAVDDVEVEVVLVEVVDETVEEVVEDVEEEVDVNSAVSVIALLTTSVNIWLEPE